MAKQSIYSFDGFCESEVSTSVWTCNDDTDTLPSSSVTSVVIPAVNSSSNSTSSTNSDLGQRLRCLVLGDCGRG
jgi:hypothetical protein